MKKAILISLVVTQLLYVVSLLFWWIFWVIGSTYYDDISLELKVLHNIFTLYPIFIVICAICSWILYRKRPISSFVINLVPTIIVIVFLTYLL
nr:hypothetical protein [Lysinibacillus timonensis]